MTTLEQQRVQWGEAILGLLDDPVDVNNLITLVAWETGEGGGFGNEASNNPINSTLPYNGSTPINSVGVQAYKTYLDGLTATVLTLKNGFYPNILAGLKASTSPAEMANVIGSEPWGTPAQLIIACIPSAQAAVAQYYTPPPDPPEDDNVGQRLVQDPKSKGWWLVVDDQKAGVPSPTALAALQAEGIPTASMTEAELNALTTVQWGGL